VRNPAALFLIGLALAGLGACATGISSESLQTWIGKPAAALTQDWGPATREVSDGDRRILIYEQLDRSTAIDFQTRRPTMKNTYGRAEEIEALPPAATVYVRSYLFWVDRDGVIVQSAVREP
jgi:hypothetical protein